MKHSECVDHVHLASVSFYHLNASWPRTPPSPSPVPHTIARACMSEGAPKVLDTSMVFLVPFVLVLSLCRLPPRLPHTWPAQQLMRVRNASYYTDSESSILHDHSWVWFASRHEISPEVSTSFPRAFDVPSALSINGKHRREGMPGVASKWCTIQSESVPSFISGTMSIEHMVNWAWCENRVSLPNIFQQSHSDVKIYALIYSTIAIKVICEEIRPGKRGSRR